MPDSKAGFLRQQAVSTTVSTYKETEVATAKKPEIFAREGYDLEVVAGNAVYLLAVEGNRFIKGYLVAANDQKSVSRMYQKFCHLDQLRLWTRKTMGEIVDMPTNARDELPLRLRFYDRRGEIEGIETAEWKLSVSYSTKSENMPDKRRRILERALEKSEKERIAGQKRLKYILKNIFRSFEMAL